MEPKTTVRGKYKKHKEGYKVSVRHYIHSKITATLANGEVHRPLYVQLIAKQSTINFKSRIETQFCSVEELNRLIDEDTNFQRLLKREKENLIHMTKKDIEEDGEKFNVVGVPHLYNQLSDFGVILQRKLTQIICAVYGRQSETEYDASIFHRFYDVHPSILFNKWQNIPAISQIKDSFKSDLWNFDFYYKQFLNSAGESMGVRPSLIPLQLDYESGYLKEEMVTYFSDKQDIIIKAFDDIEAIMSTEVSPSGENLIFLLKK